MKAVSKTAYDYAVKFNRNENADLLKPEKTKYKKSIADPFGQSYTLFVLKMMF